MKPSCRYGVVALFALGCAHSTSYVVGPDGRSWIAIDCRARTSCYDRAAAECPQGYETRGGSGHVNAVNVLTNTWPTDPKGWDSGGGDLPAAYAGMLVIRCRGPAGASLQAARVGTP